MNATWYSLLLEKTAFARVWTTEVQNTKFSGKYRKSSRCTKELDSSLNVFFSKEALLMSGLFYAVGSSYCFLAVPFAPDTVDISGLWGGGKQPVTDNTLQGSHSTWKTWKPGKMRVHLENLEISWNFVKFNKYHGKMTCNLEKLCGY